MNKQRIISRRGFLLQAAQGAAGLGSLNVLAKAGLLNALGGASSSHRLGVVGYNYQYVMGLLKYRTRPGERRDNLWFIETAKQSGANAVQILGATLEKLEEAALKEIRAKGEALGVAIELHGGTAFQKDFDKAFVQAPLLGAKVIGCNLGMLMRPDKIPTLQAWDEHTRKCEARLKEMAQLAKKAGVVVGVENHLDFTLEEFHALIKAVDSPQIGVMLDIANWYGTFDDPVVGAELLAPLTVTTHFKDFALEAIPTGIRLTMVPLGCGSMDLPSVAKALTKGLRPEVSVNMEMLCGQQLDLHCLEDRFWVPFRNKSKADVTAMLASVKRKHIARAELRPLAEIDALPYEQHVELELQQTKRCLEYCKQLGLS